MSRRWRRAESERLFSTEAVSPAVLFVAAIEGDLSDIQITLLKDCATMIKDFGANSSRGMGVCELKLAVVS